jgi:predicted ATPase/DNA-binding winged helix-turn-helix (wHTH) protein
MITVGSLVDQHSPGANGLPSLQAEAAQRSLQADRDASTTAIRAASPTEPEAAFGPFRLLSAQRLLLEGDEPVRLGSRALEILIALVERSGELVSKDELVARVWPNIFVEESNLKVQVAGLRRALGDRRGSNRYLVTIPGRGYRFVAPVRVLEGPGAAAPRNAAGPGHHLPARVTRMIDRRGTLKALAAQLPHHRLITIVGPGGIGKTTVALAVAEGLIEACRDGIRFVDLAPIVDPLQVPQSCAAALGLEIGSENPIPGLVAALRDKQMLLVLDNCEHVIETAAALAIRILRHAPDVQILATSREPLRAEGEYVHRLAPLQVPRTLAGLTAAKALGFPAVQLFVERAAAALGAFELDDSNAPIVADICRKLDGLPLAIELAAGRIDAFGLRGLAMRLDDPFRLLTGGRRSALPRHSSLRAALAWGHDLLPERERVVLRRLAIFARGFTLEAASAVAAGAGIAAAEVVECVANLVTKSLIVADVGGPVPCYHLLETTRAYALQKLTKSGEFEQVERRYAEHLGNPV